MPRSIAYDVAAFALALLTGCAAPVVQQGAPAPGHPTGSAPASRPAAAPDDAAGAPVLVRLLVLDTHAADPKRLPDDRSFLAGASAVLAEVAGCRAQTRSRAHWVEIEWHVDDAGEILETVAHPVFIPPEGQPRAIDDATLRCIERRAAAPPFTAAKGRPTARVFALVGFELPALADGAPARDLPFYPEPDGYCRLHDECPEHKHCEQPPRVHCPRAGEVDPAAPVPEGAADP